MWRRSSVAVVCGASALAGSCVLLVAEIARGGEEKPVNLLALAAAQLEHASATQDERTSFSALADGKPATTATATASAEAPLTVVYGFGGSQVALEKLILVVTKGDKEAPPAARVDLLVSSLSAHAGFQSVRTDPLVPDGKPQEFAFAPIGAKWIMLRFFPDEGAERVTIADVSVLGRVGIPQSRYAFKESPAKAFDVLEKLAKISALDAKITGDEAKLFEDAADGKLDRWSFGEAALLASGATDGTKRKAYLAQFDKIETEARKAIAKASTPFDKGEALLKFLHTDTMSKGYRSEQTDVSGILESGTFNCVSSATLYNIIGRRLGLDCRAIEVPEHAFSIVYDGTKHADVETTTPDGFNPLRDRAAQERFTKLTGFAYVPESNRHDRREVGEVGLVAITYYNHGVELSREKRFHEALLAYFRAMSLDREFDSAVKNALSVLANWSVELAKAERYDEAIGVVSTGLELAPADATLVHNHQAVWTEWARMLIEDGKSDEALAVLRKADMALPEKGFVDMQSWIVIGPGEEFVKTGEWEKAITLVEPGEKKLDPEPAKEVRKWSEGLFHRWSQSEQKAGRFDKAIEVLDRARQQRPDDREVVRHLAYVVQEWIRDMHQQGGAVKSESLMADLLKRYGTVEEVREVAESHAHRVVGNLADQGKLDEAIAVAERHGKLLDNADLAAELARATYDRHASKFTKQQEWQKATEVYSAALARFPDDAHLKNNMGATWDSWASELARRKLYGQALDVYEKALKSHPEPSRVENNIRYYLQEWSAAARKEKGEDAAEEVLKTQLERFKAVEGIDEVAKGHFQRAVADLVKAEKYADALATADRSRAIVREDQQVAELAYRVYDAQATARVQKTKDWQGAIDVYRDALKKFSDDAHLKNNAVATWDRWAQTFIAKKDWAGAIHVYEQALKQFPENGTLSNNLAFCRREGKR